MSRDRSDPSDGYGAASKPPLGCQRDHFSLPGDLHYLNCAYMGPLPRVSEEAGVAGLRKKGVPTSITPDDFFRDSDELRRLFAGLIGVSDPRRIAIQPGASYGISTAARNLPVGSGDNIVLTHEQFPGNVYAWRRKADECGASIRTIGPVDGMLEGRGRAWNERLLEAVDARTAVVAVPHVHWTDGTRFDLEALGARCRDVGAALVVDATQSIGGLPFDVSLVRPDVLVAAAYKWLLGPYALAVGYFSERFDAGTPLEETWIGRKDSHDFPRLVDYQDEYQPGAIRYDCAERSNFALVPIASTSLKLITEWTPARIQEYCRSLTAEMLQSIEGMGFFVESPEWRGHNLFGVRLPMGVDMARLKAELEARNVSASLRGSALRLSPNVYNDASDIDALVAALKAMRT